MAKILNSNQQPRLSFSVGGHASDSSNPADDVGVPIQEILEQGESKEDTLNEVSELKPTGPWNSTVCDKADYIEKMEAIVALASLNVSKATLKRIDPKLRPPKQVSREIPNMGEGLRRDSIMQDTGANTKFHTTAEMDLEGMQMIEGGKSLDSI